MIIGLRPTAFLLGYSPNLAEDIGFEPMHQLRPNNLANCPLNHLGNLPFLAGTMGIEPTFFALTARYVNHCTTYLFLVGKVRVALTYCDYQSHTLLLSYIPIFGHPSRIWTGDIRVKGAWLNHLSMGRFLARTNGFEPLSYGFGDRYVTVTLNPHFGGKLEIWTLGEFPHACFQDKCLKPGSANFPYWRDCSDSNTDTLVNSQES